MRVGKAGVERLMVAQNRVDKHERIRLCKTADELRCQFDLLDRAAVAGENGVKFHAELFPVRGKQPHILRHVLHDKAGKAARVRR